MITDQNTKLILDRLHHIWQELSMRNELISSKIDMLHAEAQINNAYIVALIQSDALASQRLSEVEARLQRLEPILQLNEAAPSPPSDKKPG